MGLSGGFFTFCLCLLSVALFSACGGKEERSTSKNEDQTLLEYVDPVSADRYSCAFGPQEGESAQPLGAPQIVETPYFKKQYDQSFLLAVSRASIEQTYIFINQVMGVDVYRVKLLEAQCRAFSGLRRAPQDLIEVWKNVENNVAQSNKKMNVSGIYLPKGGKNIQTETVLPSTLMNPAILIPDAASRWNLVHEMMHHLFNQRRLETGFSTLDSVLRQFEFFEDELQKAMWSFDKKPTNDGAASMTSKLELYSKISWAALVNFQLEEVTIENVLLKKYADKVLAYFPDTLQSSRFYINVKASEANDRLKRIKALTTEFRVKFLTKLEDTDGLMAFLDAIDAKVTKWQDEIGQSTGLPSGIGGLGQMAGGKKYRPRGFICSHDDSFMSLDHFPKF